MTVPPILIRQNALFLDLDGTLAPIVDDPARVAIEPEAIGLLERAAQFLGGAAAIISGRDLRDLDLRAPRFLTRIGAHGLETARPGEPPAPVAAPSPPRLLAAMARIAESHPGVWLETKGPVVAIHYRSAPEQGGAILEEVRAAVAVEASYCAQIGKMVVEAKPALADKGRALRAAMGAAPFAARTPVMVGDDTTDESAFAAAAELGGFGVKVGAGETLAKFRLADPRAVIAWLKGAVG